jgi:hypothetical protein
MNKLVVPAVDAVRAKILARAVQRRHQELGTTVSLNHAYEAVAAVCGFETWSRMKSRLGECTVSAEVGNPVDQLIVGSENALVESTLSFDDFVPHDVTPSIVVSGPNDLVKVEILKEMIIKWRLHNGPQARVRIVTKRPNPSYVEQLKNVLAIGDRGNIDPDFELSRIGALTILNPFDTALGMRQPTPPQRARLVELLSTIISEDEHEVSGTKSLAGLLVDSAYDAVSDRTRDGKPNLFVRGTDRRIDDKFSGVERKATWWDVVEELSLRGEKQLALQAQAFAVPRLEMMMRLLRDEHITAIWGSAKTRHGETLLDQAARRISMAVRACYTLQHPSNKTIDPNIRSIILDVDGDLGPFGKITHRVFSELFCSEVLFGQSQSKERTLLVLDNLDEVSCANFLASLEPVLKGPGSKKLHMISLVTSVQQAERHSDASSFLVHGFETRAEVSAFQKLLDFGEDAFENAHNLLFSADRSHSIALGVRRGFRNVADGMVSIP